MPTKPEVKTLEATSADILNAIRNEASADYQAAVPTANFDENNIKEIGKVITSYLPFQNEFLDALVNRIGRVIITSKLYTNPWARFKKGMLELGETVEEIFVNIATPYEYNPEQAEQQVFRRVKPDVRAAFHTLNFTKFYKQTINRAQLRQAFVTWDGVTDLISKITQSMTTGANYDELLTMKYLIAQGLLTGKFYPVNVPTATAVNSDSIVTLFKGISNDMEFMSTTYNYSGVETFSEKSRQYLIVNAKFDAVMDVETLATAFNMDKAEFMGHKIMVDSFGKLDSVRLGELFGDDPNFTPLTSAQLTALDAIPAVLVDEDWFMIFDNLIETGEIYNPEGLYWNYWLHTWKIFSSSPFANAVAFVPATPAVTSVTVTPAAPNVAAGQNINFSATVAITNYASAAVTWSVSGNNDANTYINPQGLLHVGRDETAKTLTIKAVSTYDNTKSGTATATNTSAPSDGG